MRKTMLLFVWLSVSLVAALPQDEKKKGDKPKPDFSGTWILDRSKSNLGRFARGPLANAELTLHISHQDPELKIKRTVNLDGRQQAQELTYYTDGRGETNPPAFGQNDVKSKTKWEGDKIVSKASSSFAARGETFYIDTSERRELSGDSKTLIISVAVSSSQGTEVTKQVFNRSS